MPMTKGGKEHSSNITAQRYIAPHCVQGTLARAIVSRSKVDYLRRCLRSLYLAGSSEAFSPTSFSKYSKMRSNSSSGMSALGQQGVEP
jgi:hypothetical protein